ncbi:MAG: hypothetical protein RL559_1452 [Pseudomonadota bacterium]|jgi:carbon monoxide dehydrogenase subunit G
MDFKIDATLPTSASALWQIFFDVQRVAALIPGCEDVQEIEHLQRYAAVMRQKIGPFKLEVPAQITIESHEPERSLVLCANGSDRHTGTAIDVRMHIGLKEQSVAEGAQCRLDVEATLQVTGRLASLGYPIVKKRSEELFQEFQRRLHAQLSGVSAVQDLPVHLTTNAPVVPRGDATTAPGGQPMSGPRPVATERSPAAQGRRTELVLVWPRVGISLAVALVVAHAAVALDQSPWWWLVAPLLGLAAGLDKRRD